MRPCRSSCKISFGTTLLMSPIKVKKNTHAETRLCPRRFLPRWICSCMAQQSYRKSLRNALWDRGMGCACKTPPRLCPGGLRRQKSAETTQNCFKNEAAVIKNSMLSLGSAAQARTTCDLKTSRIRADTQPRGS